MFLQISRFLTNGVAACVSWVTLFFDKTGTAGLFIVCFIAYQAVRLLLTPLIGQASSDTVGAWYSGTKLGQRNSQTKANNRPVRTSSRRKP